MEQKNPGLEKALQKIRHYCAYQERSHFEARNKLYEFGLYKRDVEVILADLISENFLNEERYAIAFARGKFNIKHWGRLKIKHALKQNQVSDACIKLALSAIDKNDYMLSLRQLWTAKEQTLKAEKNELVKKQKLFTYLMQKGFEQDMIYKASEDF